VNPVGKPDAGNPHVRFDERGGETERLPKGSSHRALPRLYPQTLARSDTADYFRVMNVNDPKIASLRANVTAASQEFEKAVQFHEVWKPAAYDEDLRKRMGVSYATNAFHVVRRALRQEMLLALTRLWDKNPSAIRMEFIAETVGNKDVINALAGDRVARIGIPESEGQMREDMGRLGSEVIALVKKYSKGGSHSAVREKLLTLRHERLAHRQTEASAATGADATDEEIESFYQDISTLIRILLSLVVAVGFEPQEAAEVYRHYATLFWAGVRGERDEGHPNYRAPPCVTPAT
jgi:hypothetical protein